MCFTLITKIYSTYYILSNYHFVTLLHLFILTKITVTNDYENYSN